MAPLMTAAEVARLYSVSIRTCYAWVDSQLLPARKVGPHLLRFAPEDLAEFERRSQEASR